MTNEQTEYVYFNTKPSNRVLDSFKREFPMAVFCGRKWKSKVTTFRLPKDVYEANKEKLKQYGSKERGL